MPPASGGPGCGEPRGRRHARLRVGQHAPAAWALSILCCLSGCASWAMGLCPTWPYGWATRPKRRAAMPECASSRGPLRAPLAPAPCLRACVLHSQCVGVSVDVVAALSAALARLRRVLRQPLWLPPPLWLLHGHHLRSSRGLPLYQCPRCRCAGQQRYFFSPVTSACCSYYLNGLDSVPLACATASCTTPSVSGSGCSPLQPLFHPPFQT